MTSSKRALAKARSAFHQGIRKFFGQNDFVETQTPLLSTSLIPESSIEVFKTEQIINQTERKTLFLTPSPEIYMKQLISEGIGDCYQLTKSFRNAEEQSIRHLNEFTMLEWYAMNKDYRENIAITIALLRSLAPLACESTRHLFTDFVEVSMNQLFLDFAKIDLETCQTLSSFKEAAITAGFTEFAEKSEDWETLFHFIFVGHVELKLPQDQTVFVTNYPTQIPTTAKHAGEYYERWELYIAGWEIANCYTEETRYEHMYTLFKEEGALKDKMLVPHPVDFEYLEIFKNGKFPPCSGVALGVDRLFAIAHDLGHVGC